MPPETDRTIADLDAALATRGSQRADAVAKREAAELARTATAERLDASRLAALTEGRPGSRTAYDDALADRTRAELELQELDALIKQLDAEIARLTEEHTAARQARARAAVEQQVRSVILPLAAKADILLGTFRMVLISLTQAKRDLRRTMLAADLPEAHNSKRFGLDYVDRILRWELAEFGMSGVRHHHLRGRTLLECEAAVQGIAPEPGPADAPQPPVDAEPAPTTH